MKTFQAKNDSVAGIRRCFAKWALSFIRRSGPANSALRWTAKWRPRRPQCKKYRTTPRVAIIHFGRASNVYLLVGNGGGGDASTAGKMVELAGGQMAIQQSGMQRMVSPEIIAKSNPEVILMTEYGFDRLGSMEQAKTLPGVAETDAARHNRIYRVPEHELMYFGPDTGDSIIEAGEAHPSMKAAPGGSLVSDAVVRAR